MDNAKPIDLRTAETYEDGTDEETGERYFCAYDDALADGSPIVDVTGEEYRIIGQFEAARERQRKAALAVEARSKPPAPPREREPGEIPAGGKLTPRQQEFSRRYAAQPVAALAAALAGYAEDSARNQGHRLLKNPLVLDRVAAIRAERNLHYVLEADTLHDKLEALFFDALGDRNHAAAVAALRLQAGLGGLLARRPAGAAAAAAPKRKKKPATKAPRHRHKRRAAGRKRRTRA